MFDAIFKFMIIFMPHKIITSIHVVNMLLFTFFDFRCSITLYSLVGMVM